MYSISVLNSTFGNINYTGSNQQTPGIIALPDTKNNIVLVLSSFIGRIYIEGSTVDTSPNSTDWYPIQIGANLNYIQFPYNTTYTIPTTGIFVYNFSGNFTWIRARVDRSYLIPIPTNPYSMGFVEQIWINYDIGSNCNVICDTHTFDCHPPTNQWNNKYTNDPFGDPCYYPQGPQRNPNGPWYNPIGPNESPGYTYGPWQGPYEGMYYGPNCDPCCPTEYTYGQGNSCGPYVGPIQGCGPYNGPVTYFTPNKPQSQRNYDFIRPYGKFNGNPGYYDPAWPPNNC